MQKLTAKEEELMQFFWSEGPLFVKEILEMYDDPKPHFNTLSTFVRGLEEKGFLAHKIFGNTYQYYAVISKSEYSQGSLNEVISKYFGNSYMRAVSTFVKDEKISVQELKRLIRKVENGTPYKPGHKK